MSEHEHIEPDVMMTPTNGAVTPSIKADPRPEEPAVAAPEPKAEVNTAPAAPAAPSREYESELAAKDIEIKKLETAMAKIEGASKDAQDERLKLIAEVAKLINERDDIVKAKDQALESKQQELAEVSKATQDLSQKTLTLEQQLAAEKAKATKLEVLTAEYPHLIRYAKYIVSSSDPDDVRRECRAFEQARESDLSEYRQVLSGGQAMRTVPTGTPVTRVESSIDDTEQLEERLASIMNESPSVFQAELDAIIRNYNARR